MGTNYYIHFPGGEEDHIGKTVWAPNGKHILLNGRKFVTVQGWKNYLFAIAPLCEIKDEYDTEIEVADFVDNFMVSNPEETARRTEEAGNEGSGQVFHKWSPGLPYGSCWSDDGFLFFNTDFC